MLNTLNTYQLNFRVSKKVKKLIERVTMMEKPFIFMFKQNGKNYLYDVNRHKILSISSEEYNQLEDFDGNDINHTSYISQLINNGFLQPSKIQEIRHPMTNYVSNYLNNKIAKVTLQVTQNCNFRCGYCTYSGNYNNRSHSNQVMSVNIAHKAIDFLFKHSFESKQINIGFYGGEPLLEFDLIKNCVEYAEKQSTGKSLSFSLTTNGSLINYQIIEYLKKHDIAISISIDGPKEIHNKNRKFINGCGSFEKVHENIRFIRNTFPDYYKNKVNFLMVLDPQSNMTCLNKFCTSELFDDVLMDASFINNLYKKNRIYYNEKFSIQWEYEKFKFYLYKLGRLKEVHVSKLLRTDFQELNNIFKEFQKDVPDIPEVVHHGGPCIPGQLRLFINTIGDFFPCERVSEISQCMKIGHVDYGFDFDKVKMLLNIGKLSEQACKKCFAIRLL